VWEKIKQGTAILFCAGLLVAFVWFLYAFCTDGRVRASFAHRMFWYAVWAAASWVISALWKRFRPKEEVNDRAQVQESEPQSERRRNKRPKRGR
jgi:hypothetical protein